MTEQDIIYQKDRMKIFDKLDARRKVVRDLIKQVTEKWEHGPHGQGPFTGNTRESREIATLGIMFSKTKGGSPPVGMVVTGLYIDAYRFGQMLERELRLELDDLTKRIEAL